LCFIGKTGDTKGVGVCLENLAMEGDLSARMAPVTHIRLARWESGSSREIGFNGAQMIREKTEQQQNRRARRAKER